MNVLKPRFPGETYLPEKFGAEPTFPICRFFMYLENKKSVLKENCLPVLLLIDNCLSKEHTSMEKGDSPWVMSSVVLFPLQWLRLFI